MSITSIGKTRTYSPASQIPFGWDLLRATTFTAQLLIAVYVSIGWLGTTRIGLFMYLLLLPVIVLQWLLNAGASIFDNAENLVRTGRWHDARNRFEGHFFQTMLGAIGVRAGTVQINIVVCLTMLIFWIEAFFRMVMIPTAL